MGPIERQLRPYLERVRQHGEGGKADFSFRTGVKGTITLGWYRVAIPPPILPVWEPEPEEVLPIGPTYENRLDWWRVTVRSPGEPEKHLEFFGESALVDWWEQLARQQEQTTGEAHEKP